jgi:hypothetical protein
MIRYALLCEHEHEFDGWFRSSAAFDEQAAAGGVECPACGTRKVRKALMAPGIARGGKKDADEAGKADPARQMLMMMTALRRHVEENCDYVGDKFAETARRIHYGEEPHRDIYGEATPEEARELVEDGVEVMPLPGMPRSRLS